MKAVQFYHEELQKGHYDDFLTEIGWKGLQRRNVTRKMAKCLAPFAVSIIAEIDGGYMCFESFNDYRTWRNQK